MASCVRTSEQRVVRTAALRASRRPLTRSTVAVGVVATSSMGNSEFMRLSPSGVLFPTEGQDGDVAARRGRVIGDPRQRRDA